MDRPLLERIVPVDMTMRGAIETGMCAGIGTEVVVESDGAPKIVTSIGTAVGPRSRGLTHSLTQVTSRLMLRRHRSRMQLLLHPVSIVRRWEGYMLLLLMTALIQP